MERLRSLLSRWLFSPLQGATLGNWWRALRDNGFRVAPAYWPRAALTTLTAAHNSLQARRERRRHGEAWEGLELQPPVFVLGHYRSGTTHLHNLLAKDPRFGFPNNYQANFPATFLVTEGTGARIGSLFTMRKRPHDNVRLDLRVPTEDELATCADTLLSTHMGWHFPRRERHYRRYLTFREADEEERRRWRRSLRRFAAKLALKQGNSRLVLKSPCHTARVALILEAFPDAAFVHVHRNPYDVYRSTLNMELEVEPLFQYQEPDHEGLEERILWRYRTMYEAYLEDRSAIPDGRLVEIAYGELDERPMAVLERVYGALGLPDFEVARPHVSRYLESIADYRKNLYPELEPDAGARIAREWELAFEEWGYPR